MIFKTIYVKGYVWHLDLYSTILSRKHSFHKRIGKLQYVRVKKTEGG